MTNSLLSGLNASTRTTNGMRAHASTMSKNVDLFFAAGASRGKDISGLFRNAAAEDLNIAVRILQWTRDIRGGAGERQLFRDILAKLAGGSKAECEVAAKLIPKVPELGRWDDLLVLFNTPLEADVALFIGQALADKNGLAAKWMPRKGDIAVKLRQYWQLTPRQYRKLLVTLTNVVETKMCAQQWDTIEFDKLPSVASARYQKAFGRNAEAAYAAYKAGLEKGTTTINAGAVYPYDITKSLRFGDAAVANAQWAALPDFMAGSKENVLVMADTSGSMSCSAGGSNNVTCMDVCVSLAMYISERSRGAFQNAFLTFSSSPTLQILTGKTLRDRYHQLSNAAWGMSTNLTAAFEQVLMVAKRDKVPAEDMPSMILIMSDMQFNQCSRYDETAMGAIAKRYEIAGYEMPKIVFWNLNARPDTAPATVSHKNVALVSGFSPAIMKSVLAGDDFTAEGIMLKTVLAERYDWQ